jgi:hypothetical protein
MNDPEIREIFFRAHGYDRKTHKSVIGGLQENGDYVFQEVGISSGDTDRCENLYHHDGTDIAERVEKWCLGRGQRADHRIVVAGYDTEYRRLIDSGWIAEKWKANGGYANTGNGRGKANSNRETLFISPHCKKQSKQMGLF